MPEAETTTPQSQEPPVVDRKATGKEIGQSGTLIFQGIITAEDYNSRLSGAQLIEKVEIMRRSSSTVRSTLLVVKLPILSADWKVQPATDADGNVADEDQLAADYCNRELFDREIDFFDLIRQGLTMLDFGFCVFEKVHGMCDFDGKPYIGLDKIAFRKQNTIYKWEMDDGGAGIHQMISNGNEFDIPRAKLLIFTNDKEGDNYEGISLLRYAHKDWDMLDKLTIVNAMALERMGIGVPVTTAKEGQTPTPKDIIKAENVLRNFRANQESFLNIPETMMVEMLDMKANSTKEIIPTLQYHDRRMSQAILAQFMDLGGQSGSGAQALAKDLTSLFMKSEESTAKTLQAAIMADIIKPLCDLNFSNLVNGYPKLVYGSIADDDLSETASSLGTLAEKKLITPDIDTETHLREKYHLPAMSEEARKAYKQNQEMAKAAAEALANPDNTDPSARPGEAQPKNKPGEKPKPPAQKVKADALEDARRSRRTLLDVVLN